MLLNISSHHYVEGVRQQIIISEVVGAVHTTEVADLLMVYTAFFPKAEFFAIRVNTSLCSHIPPHMVILA